MAPTENSKGPSGGLGRMLDMGRRLLDKQDEAPPAVERRAGKRVPLPIPVRVRVGDGEFYPARVRDVNQPGLSVEPAFGCRGGEHVTLSFEGFPGAVAACIVEGQVVRIVGPDASGLGIRIDRQRTPPDSLRDYRALLLHYMRHKPLLADIDKGYFQGRCTSCGWVGRVGQKTPRCPQCAQKVAPL
jgi:hypothetical protein